VPVPPPPPPAPAAPPAEPAARPRRSPRAWFRARLDRDPRRWVVAIAGLEGLAAFTVNLQEKRDTFYGRGVGLAVLLAFCVLLPALGALGMLAHGRLLLWTGKLLGGRAAPREIHAAFAWSQLPLVVAALPLVAEIPLRAAAAEAEPVPGWLDAALAGLEGAAEALLALAVLAALAGLVLYVKFLAEAQRFSAWRALANHVLAALLGVALLLGGAAAAHGLWRGAGPYQLVPLALALTVAAPLAVERAVVLRRRRAAGARRG
jgi:Yip1-like protein